MLIREVVMPEPSEATVVDMLASCAAARTGDVSRHTANTAATPVR